MRPSRDGHDRREFIKVTAGTVLSLLGCQKTSIAADPAVPSSSGQLASDLRVSSSERSTLRDAAAQKGLLFGASIKREIGISDPAYTAVLAASCHYLATEAEFHWQFMAPRRGVRDWARSEWARTFITQLRLRIRGGNLIWHHRLPEWLGRLSAADALAEMELQVEAIVGRYAGQVFSWDVVNEAIEPKHGRSDGLRYSPLSILLGTRFIDAAFHAAARRDPSAILVYNEYGYEYERFESLAKRKNLLFLLEGLRCRGVPVHALGLQSHLRAAEKSFSEARFSSFLKDVTDMGYKLIITEMDVADNGLPGDFGRRDQAVADRYEQYLNVVLDNTSTIAVNTWGLSDHHSWLSSVQPRADGLPVRTLPLDSQNQFKPAWHAIGRALAGAPVRRPLQPATVYVAEAPRRECGARRGAN